MYLFLWLRDPGEKNLLRIAADLGLADASQLEEVDKPVPLVEGVPSNESEPPNILPKTGDSVLLV